MATLTLTLVAGTTNSQTLTFSATDANRILTAYQNMVQPGGLAPDFMLWLSGQTKKHLVQMVVQSETAQPTAPVMT